MSTVASARRMYDNQIATDIPHFAIPETPTKLPHKDTMHRRSPTKQLRAGASATMNFDEYDRLVRSGITTLAEKELATRVVRAVERLKEWCREIEQWGWTGSFDKHYGSKTESNPPERPDPRPSLAREKVDEYDARLDAIEEELEALEVDDLKEQILGIHLGRSRPSSSYSSTSMTTPVLYDDFQLFVTESLLYSLPYHAKLKHYLKTWRIRVDVFQEIPAYLHGLSFLEEIVKEAWQGLEHAATPETEPTEIMALEEQLVTAQAALKHRVLELGKQLDRMLDILEGQEDCLPDDWIDRYEDNEKSFSEWSYQADRKLFHLRHLDRQSIAKAKAKDQASTILNEDGPEQELSGSDLVRDVTAPAVEIRASPTSAKVNVPPEHANIHLHKNAEDTASEAFPAVNEYGKGAEEDELSDQEQAVIAEVVHRPVEAVLRRASVASIESFTRDQVKSVDVPSRRSSVASFSSVKRPISRSFDTPATPSRAESVPRRPSRTTSPLATEPTTEWLDLHAFTEPQRPQTPSSNLPIVRRNSGSSLNSPGSDMSDQLELGEESPSVRAHMSQSSKPPLNFAMKKRRSNHSVNATNTASVPFPDQELAIDTSLPTIPASPTKIKSPVSPSVPLEEQISTILESLPANIKLKASSAPNAPDIKPKHKRRTSTSSNVSSTSDVPRPGPRSRAVTPSLTGRPGFTLAPADDLGSRRGANDPEIKVYHLMSGNDKPLKLFIRRVGENGERVMVRVGGGWADLGEYLKTYAEHHGHRTVSDGRVEVLGLGNDRIVTPSSANGGRNSSLGFRNDSRMEGAETRSTSRLGLHTDSRQSTRSDSRMSSFAGSTGYPSITAGIDKDPSTSPPSSNNDTPEPKEDISTPTSASTSATGSHRRISALWNDGGSLMGPAAVRKGTEISNEKKEWVDSVVEQAKKVGRKVEFGDLKKVGGTRRVFMKGRSTSGTGSTATSTNTSEKE